MSLKKRDTEANKFDLICQDCKVNLITLLKAHLVQNLICQLVGLGYTTIAITDGSALVANLKSHLEVFNYREHLDEWPMNIYIETERLIIRSFRDLDIAGIYQLDSDPEVHTYLGKNPMKSMHQAEEIIKGIKKQYLTNGFGRLAIIDKKTDEFIGWSGIKLEQSIRDFDYYDLGYRLRKKYWGQGIATEASIASLKYGFEERHLQKDWRLC